MRLMKLSSSGVAAYLVERNRTANGEKGSRREEARKQHKTRRGEEAKGAKWRQERAGGKEAV